MTQLLMENANAPIKPMPEKLMEFSEKMTDDDINKHIEYMTKKDG